MPPQQFPSKQNADTSHMLPPHRKGSSIGPFAGIVIILLVLAFGAFYFWGAALNKRASQQELPYIPADTSQEQSQ